MGYLLREKLHHVERRRQTDAAISVTNQRLAFVSLLLIYGGRHCNLVWLANQFAGQKRINHFLITSCSWSFRILSPLFNHSEQPNRAVRLHFFYVNQRLFESISFFNSRVRLWPAAISFLERVFSRDDILSLACSYVTPAKFHQA